MKTKRSLEKRGAAENEDDDDDVTSAKEAALKMSMNMIPDEYIQMNDGDMANPRPLYGACVRTAEVVCTTRTSFGQKRYHVSKAAYTPYPVLIY